MTGVGAWTFFDVEVASVTPLSPSFLRLTLVGPDVDHFADNGYDQRIKLVVPLPDYGLAHLPTGPDWYARWRALPEALRNPVRTYTVRAVRPAAREVDIDVVRHGDVGPASRWAGAARPGDRAGLIGPDARFDGSHGGVEFRPPAPGVGLLLAGDETAVPAVASIMERLAPGTPGTALLEVPEPADALDLAVPPGMTVTWLPRNGAEHGQRLIPAVAAAAAALLGPAADPAPPIVDTDELWDVPADAPTGCHAWIAGESAVIRTLRRHLVSERGLDRRAVAFMGYWRLGRSEGT